MIDLRTIIDNLPNAIFVVDRNHRILLSNRLAQEFHSLDHQENKAKRFGDIVGCINAYDDVKGCGFSRFCHCCHLKEMIDQLFATKKSAAQCEIDITTCSTGVRNFRITANHIRFNEKPTPEQEICIVTVDDMTEFKKREQLAAAIETIGAICHEMNQPLQAIIGNVELLEQFPLEDGAIVRIEKICNEIKRIKNMTKKLMNVTNYQTKPYLSTKILDIEKSASN